MRIRKIDNFAFSITTLVLIALPIVTPISNSSALDLPTYAYDGDDIMLAGQDYRLEGVDAFEDGQRCQGPTGASFHCAAEARMTLQSILGGRDVECFWTGKKHGRRLIATCKADQLDVEKELVARGWAFVRPDFIRHKPQRLAELCAIEAEARQNKRGVWAWFDADTGELPYHWKGGRKPRKEVTCPH